MSNKLQQAIEETKRLMGQGDPDPCMQNILKQLEAASRGEKHDYALGRMIMANYQPAPTHELQDWADLILDVNWELRSNGGM